MGGAVFPPCYLPGAKLWCFPCGSDGKESTCNVGGLGSIPGMGRSPGEGKGYLYTEYSSILAWRLGHDWVTFTFTNYSGVCESGGSDDNGDLLQKVPCIHCYWEGNRQEGQGSPNGGNSLQMSDILPLLSGRRKQTSNIFSFSIQI